MDDRSMAALRQASLFQALSNRQQEQLASIAKERDFSTGQRLAAAGDENALAMWVLVEGAVDVIRDGAKVAELGPGDHVGEIALLASRHRRTADLVASAPTRAVQITKWDLEPMVRANPDLAMAIIDELACRLDDANARLGAPH
jgi:CRP-like cAMP-binding protein